MTPAFNPADLATIGGISGVTWVLVQAVKRTAPRISGSRTVLLAAGVGTALGGIALLWQSPITPQAVATCLLTGLLGGLGSIGLDVSGRAAAKSQV